MVFLENIYEVFRVVQLFAFGYFEHEPFQWKVALAGSFQRGLHAGCGLVDGVRQKVDAQFAVRQILQPKAAGQFYGLDAARLVELITVAVVDQREDCRSGFALRASNQ